MFSYYGLQRLKKRTHRFVTLSGVGGVLLYD